VLLTADCVCSVTLNCGCGGGGSGWVLLFVGGEEIFYAKIF
jgi:hypothetical protein